MTIYYDLVEIEWQNARNHDGVQQKREDGDYRRLGCQTTNTVGYVYQESNESIGLAQNITNAGFRNEELLNVVVIPKCAIILHETLKKGQPSPSLEVPEPQD